MKVSKKLAFIVSCTVLIAACGNSGDSSKTGDKKDSPTTTTAATPPPAETSKGLELIGASDCTTCHRLDKSASGASIGPAYSEVAEKYSPAADTTITRLVKKIISGGSGVWGTVPMSAHPAIPEADIKEMVKYILTLKK